MVLALVLMVVQGLRALIAPLPRPRPHSRAAPEPSRRAPAPKRSDLMPDAVKITAFVLLVALLLGVTTGLLGAN